MNSTRFYTAIMMAVMILNTCRYHLPYIEYNLFGTYIAANLCIKRNDANNCCLGTCFLEKQIDMVNDAAPNAGNPSDKAYIPHSTDDYITENPLRQSPNTFIKVKFSIFRDSKVTKIITDILLPPPKLPEFFFETFTAHGKASKKFWCVYRTR